MKTDNLRIERFHRGKQALWISIESTPNPYLRIFRLNETVDNGGRPYFWHRNHPDGDARVSIWGQAIARALLRVSGIDQLQLYDETLHVQIGRAFDWSDIEPQVIAVLKSILLTGKATVEPTYTFPTVAKEVPVVIEECKNFTVLAFHFQQEVSSDVRSFEMRSYASVQVEALPPIGVLGRRLVLAIREVDEILMICANPYEFHIALPFRGHYWTPELRERMVTTMRQTIADYNSSQVGMAGATN